MQYEGDKRYNGEFEISKGYFKKKTKKPSVRELFQRTDMICQSVMIERHEP